MPVLGSYIADCYENKATESLRYQWRYRPPHGSKQGPKVGDGSRGGPPLRTLRLEEQTKL